MPASTADKMWLYLYSNGNIAGSLLGILGMGLFFTGLIGDYWLAIVLGLYGVGAFGFPRTKSWTLKEGMRLQGEQLRDALKKMVKQVRPKLSEELRPLMDTLSENLDYIIQKNSERDVGPFLSHFVQQTVSDYLPTAIEHYLSLPPAYRRLHVVNKGKTSRDLFKEQLQLLNSETEKVIEELHQQDVMSIQTHSRFLEDKFKDYQLLGH